MLGFSTCWNARRHREGRDLIEEIKSLGFDSIEISHGTNVSLFPGILEAVEKGEITVAGVHNFCPSPVDVIIDAPDAFEFTSPRSSDRRRAISLTLKSIEWASRFGAGYLVLHLGSARIKKYTAKLEKIARAEGILTPRYEKLKQRLIKARKSAGKTALPLLRNALLEIIPAAEEAGVKLGLEGRSHYEQIPTEEEMAELLSEFNSPCVGYWHDFGHIQRKSNLGLVDHEEWLRQVCESGRYIGAHLHDVVWPEDDHHVPFKGSISYDRLVPLLPANAPLIWEINPRRRSDDIRESLINWKEKFGD